jgi:hypothetical protein
MKKDLTNLAGRAILAALFAAVIAGVSHAQDTRGSGRLVGTWDAEVHITDCQTGAVLETFASIASFNQGGTSVGSTAGRPQASRTPEHGVWRHIAGNRYEFKSKSFNFNPMGVAVGYVVLRHEITLNETADAYVSEGGVTIYLLNGTQVGSGCSTAIGTRFSF